MRFFRNLLRIPGGWSLQIPVYAIISATVKCYSNEPNSYICPELRDFLDLMEPVPNFSSDFLKIDEGPSINIQPDAEPALQSPNPDEDHCNHSTGSLRVAHHRVILNAMRSELSKFKRQLRTMKNELSCFRMVTAKLKLQNAELRSSLEDRPHPDDVPAMCSSLQATVVLMLFDRTKSPESTKKIESLLMNIGFVLLSYSFTGYEFLKKYLPFPNIRLRQRRVRIRRRFWQMRGKLLPLSVSGRNSRDVLRILHHLRNRMTPHLHHRRRNLILIPKTQSSKRSLTSWRNMKKRRKNGQKPRKPRKQLRMMNYPINPLQMRKKNERMS
jgi:hypothetical protein